MNEKTKQMAVGAISVVAKIGKKIFIEGGKVVVAGVLIVGMEKIFRGGVTELKLATIDEMLELDDSDDTEDI